jgi:diguanylate cyclase (GGDEF)-like protein
VDGSSQIARSQRERQELAKHWLVRMIERTPLADVAELPVDWIAEQAPDLIATIVSALSDPGDPTAGELTDQERDRAAALVGLRQGPDAAEQIGRDLGALQGLLIETIRGRLPEREPGDFARSVTRLADVFGALQGVVSQTLVGELGERVRGDPLTGLPGPAQMDEQLGELLAEQRRYGHPFTLALVDVDGLGRINDAYGRSAGDRMLAAVAAVLRRQLRDVDLTFRLEEDEFAVLAPHTEAAKLVPMAKRIAGLITRSQSADGPRIAIVLGIADCPGDGVSAERLLECATEATYAAKASGAAVGRSPGAAGHPVLLQDS